MDYSLVLEAATSSLAMQDFCVRAPEKKDVGKPTSLLPSGLQAKEDQGKESCQQMGDFSVLEADTAPLRQDICASTPKEKDVKTQDDNNLTAIRDELNDQKANIIKQGCMMKELAKNIDSSKESIKTLTETVQSFLTTFQTQDPHNPKVLASHLDETTSSENNKKTNNMMPSPKPVPLLGSVTRPVTNCEVCGSLLCSPKGLKNHMGRYHPNYRGGPAGSGYNCEVCGHQFAYLGLLQFHMGRCHSDYLDRPAGWSAKPSWSAKNNQQLASSTLSTSRPRQTQSRQPSSQTRRQNGSHSDYHPHTGRQQYVPAHPARTPRHGQSF